MGGKADSSKVENGGGMEWNGTELLTVEDDGCLDLGPIALPVMIFVQY